MSTHDYENIVLDKKIPVYIRTRDEKPESNKVYYKKRIVFKEKSVIQTKETEYYKATEKTINPKYNVAAARYEADPTEENLLAIAASLKVDDAIISTTNLTHFREGDVYYERKKEDDEEVFVSEMTLLKKNPKFLIGLIQTVTKEFPKNVINRPVFKYTMLREEILFITAMVYYPNARPFMFTFATNERSFYRRFTILDKNGLAINLFTNPNVVNTIEKIIANPSDYTVTLNLLYDEEGKIKEEARTINGISTYDMPEYAEVHKQIYLDKFNAGEITNTEYESAAEYADKFMKDKVLRQGSNIVFNNLAHYNKRMFIYLCNYFSEAEQKSAMGYTGEGPFYTPELITDTESEVPCYKDPESDTFYLGKSHPLVIAYNAR